MNYKIDHNLMNNLKAVVKILCERKQDILTCQELIMLSNELTKAKVIIEPKKDIMPHVTCDVAEPKDISPLPTKPKKNDKK